MKKQAINIDVTQLIPIDELDEDELDLHNEIQKGNLVFHSDISTKAKYAEIFKFNNHQRKALSIRMLKNDYIGIKAKALELGIPYQALINSVIHRYLTGDLK